MFVPYIIEAQTTTLFWLGVGDQLHPRTGGKVTCGGIEGESGPQKEVHVANRKKRGAAKQVKPGTAHHHEWALCV